MLETILNFICSAVSTILWTFLCGGLAIVAKLIFSLVVLIIQIFFKNGLVMTNFVNFDQMITMFGRITDLNELGTVVYSISAFIIAFGIIVSGVKMSAGFLDKTGDSPQAFIKRAIYTILLLIGYKTIVAYVIQIMNAIASTGPFNMTKNIDIFGSNIIEVFGNLLDATFDIKTATTTDAVSLLISIVLYGVLITKLIPSIITYYERYISFAIYLLMGPITISLGIDPENKDIGKNWLIGILSQMMVILFSMFVYNLFLLQLKEFLFGNVDAEQFAYILNLGDPNITEGTTFGGSIGIGLSTTTVANLIVCCVLLTIVEKSESFINMLGLRTIPSGTTARDFAGRVATTIHNGMHVASGAFNKMQDYSQGTGRKNGYTALQKMGKDIGVPNANVLDHKTLLNETAYDRVSGILHKTGGHIGKEERDRLINQFVKQGQVSRRDATKAVDDSIKKAKKEAVSVNSNFSSALNNGTSISSEDIQKKVGMSEEAIKLKKGTAREVFNKETGSDILGHTKDGMEVYGFAVADDKGNSQVALFKGYKDENGNFTGKRIDGLEDLNTLNGTQLAFMADGNEKDIDSPQVQNKFKNDEQFKSLYNDAKDCQAKVERGEATREELQERVGALQQYMDDHGGSGIDPNSFVSNEKIADKFKDDKNFQSKVAEFDNAKVQLDNGQLSEKEFNEKANDLRNYIDKNGGSEELKAFDDEVAKARADEEKSSLISIGKFDSNNVLLSDSNFSAAYLKLNDQIKELDPKENNGANIATSQVKFDDKTGEMYVNTSTYRGDVKRDITKDRNGNKVVRETNQLKEVTSGERVDTSDSTFERDASSNFTGQEFGNTFKKFDNASDDTVIRNVKYSDLSGTEHDDGTRLKNKADYKAEEKAERLAEVREVEGIKTEANRQRNNDTKEFINSVSKQYNDASEEEQKGLDHARNVQRNISDRIRNEADFINAQIKKENLERKKIKEAAEKLAQQEKQDKTN